MLTLVFIVFFLAVAIILGMTMLGVIDAILDEANDEEHPWK